MIIHDDADCAQCTYGADSNRGGDVVCCYFGSRETDSSGQCEVFEVEEDEEDSA